MSIDFTVGTVEINGADQCYISNDAIPEINWANGNAYRVLDALCVECDPCGTLPIRQARLLVIGAKEDCDNFDTEKRTADMLNRLDRLADLINRGILIGCTHLGWS